MMYRNKYNARKTVVDGITFASRAEARRYQDLSILANEGIITDLQLQPVYMVAINGEHFCRYTADFRYTNASGDVVVEDVKGVLTDASKLRIKAAELFHGITVDIIRGK